MTELDQDGVEHEFTFWKRFVKEDRFTKDWCSSEKTNELYPVVYSFLYANTHIGSRILDFGSGPVSLLHGSFHPSVVEVISSDPLSTLYQQIVDFPAIGISPPLKYAAEDAREALGDVGGQVDVVHMSNAWDHAKSPTAALEAMIDILLPGGYLIIQGFENEAEWEKYQGFHQHNVSLCDHGRLLLLDKEGSGLVVEPSGGEVVHASVEKLSSGRNWVIWIWKKDSE